MLLAVTTLSFDIAGLEIYLPLIVGARVEIAPRRRRPIRGRWRAARADSAHGDAGDAGHLAPARSKRAGAGAPGLRALCGGEALPAISPSGWSKCGRLWNMYGPTETTIWSTVRACRSAGEPVPIGRPIANTPVYVLDARLQPVPIGVAGELYIGGDGLARGYRDRPDLTAERFVAEPVLGAGCGSTGPGDLARWRPDGSVEFLGRLDHQVKIRGYRIELGEIETAARPRTRRRRARWCVAREDGNGDASWSRYIVPARRRPGAGDELRARLAKDAARVHGPVGVRECSTPAADPERQDRPQGAARADARRSDGRGGRRPRARRSSAGWREIWEGVLGISPIGVTDNFFDLGVTSLVAARCSLRSSRSSARSLPLGAIVGRRRSRSSPS